MQVQNKEQKGYNVPVAKLQSQSHNPEKSVHSKIFGEF